MQRNELNAERFEFAQRVHQLRETSGKPVISRDDNGIESSFPASGEQLVELRPTLFGTADADIRKFRSDVPPSPSTIFTSLSELNVWVLACVSADARVQRRFHLKRPMLDRRRRSH